MSRISSHDTPTAPTRDERERMHAGYLRGGAARQMAPHVVYDDAECPHSGCQRRMQALDFRLENFGRSIHDPLVTAWWNDIGFAGTCPECGGWIRFTVHEKRAITTEEANSLPQLPPNWWDEALIL